MDHAAIDGATLWRRVAATVRPLKGRGGAGSPATAAPAGGAAIGPPPTATRIVRSERSGPPSTTLDGGWDRRLARGLASPDCTIDLHGHTLAAAHGALDHGLARAAANGARVILLVTGRPPPPGRSRLDNPLRGVIRASVEDWLHASPHAGRIAAIRPAHPRHGGAGALYVVLRRARLNTPA